jgi:hypothetical protein
MSEIRLESLGQGRRNVSDARLRTDDDVADNAAAGRNESAVINFGRLAIYGNDADVWSMKGHRVFQRDRWGNTDA